MAISSLGMRTTNFIAAQACVEYRSVSVVAPKILDVSFIVQGTGTAQSIGFGRSPAVGLTPVTSLFTRDNPEEPASTTTGALSWALSPTTPLIYLRRWSSAATIGVGVIWLFPRGLLLPVSSSVQIQNITTTVAADVNCIIDE